MKYFKDDLNIQSAPKFNMSNKCGSVGNTLSFFIVTIPQIES